MVKRVVQEDCDSNFIIPITPQKNEILHREFVNSESDQVSKYMYTLITLTQFSKFHLWFFYDFLWFFIKSEIVKPRAGVAIDVYVLPG